MASLQKQGAPPFGSRVDAKHSMTTRKVIARPAWVIVFTAALFNLASPAFASTLFSTNAPPISPALPEVSFSVIRVFGALALVLGLFLAGVWLFKHWQCLALQRGRPSHFQ